MNKNGKWLKFGNKKYGYITMEIGSIAAFHKAVTYGGREAIYFRFKYSGKSSEKYCSAADLERFENTWPEILKNEEDFIIFETTQPEE